ncbi:MAG TPA: PadR family transcriptional regulator [Streptosporangiaceae bacterium]|nr:PadR family transcriptional regulator [Streptosporangiaceae bacterium]
MPGKRKVGNLLALAVLSLLSQQPMHPYELGRNLREHGDDRSIKFNHGSLYMVVGQLARAGFITEQETSRGGQRPERTVYALTDAGRDELRDWLRELVAQPQHEYPAFVSALSLIAALPPSEAVGLLRARLDHLGRQQAAIRALIGKSQSDGVPGLFLIEEEYRLALLDTESAFTARLIERMNDPGTDWMGQWARFHGEQAPAREKTQTPAGENDEYQ